MATLGLTINTGYHSNIPLCKSGLETIFEVEIREEVDYWLEVRDTKPRVNGDEWKKVYYNQNSIRESGCLHLVLGPPAHLDELVESFMGRRLELRPFTLWVRLSKPHGIR